jgi:hypothetical protein
MKFSEWLKIKEDAVAAAVAPSGTTTSSIAAYPRPVMFSVRGDMFPRKHKKKV